MVGHLAKSLSSAHQLKSPLSGPFPILYLSDSHRQAGSAMRGYSLNMGNNEFYGMSKIGKGGRIYWSVVEKTYLGCFKVLGSSKVGWSSITYSFSLSLYTDGI